MAPLLSLVSLSLMSVLLALRVLALRISCPVAKLLAGIALGVLLRLGDVVASLLEGQLHARPKLMNVPGNVHATTMCFFSAVKCPYLVVNAICGLLCILLLI